MFGFLGKIFGSEKGVSDVVSGAINGIDKCFHTSEEITESNVKMVRDLQDQFAPRSITRRILAVIVYGNYFLHLNAIIVLRILYPDLNVDFLVEVISSETKVMLMVSFFYFGYYGLKKVLPPKK